MNKEKIISTLRKNFKSNVFLKSIPDRSLPCERCPISHNNTGGLWFDDNGDNITCEYRAFLFLHPDEKRSNISEEMYNWSCDKRLNFFRKECGCSLLMKTE